MLEKRSLMFLKLFPVQKIQFNSIFEQLTCSEWVSPLALLTKRTSLQNQTAFWIEIDSRAFICAGDAEERFDFIGLSQSYDPCCHFIKTTATCTLFWRIFKSSVFIYEILIKSEFFPNTIVFYTLSTIYNFVRQQVCCENKSANIKK